MTTFRIRDDRGTVYTGTDSADAVMLHGTLEKLLDRLYPGWDRAQNAAGVFSFYPKASTLDNTTLIGQRTLTVQTLAKAVAGCRALCDTGANHLRRVDVLASDAKLAADGAVLDLADQAVVVPQTNVQNLPLGGVKATLIGVSPDGSATWFATDDGLLIGGAIATIGAASAPSTILHRTAGGAYVADPDAPAATCVGTTGAVSRSYKIVAKNKQGEVTAASAAATVSTHDILLPAAGAPAVTGSRVDLVWLPPAGAASFDVYRTESTGTTATTGKIATTQEPRFSDSGIAADGSTEPAVNLTSVGSQWAAVVLF